MKCVFAEAHGSACLLETWSIRLFCKGFGGRRNLPATIHIGQKQVDYGFAVMN